MQNIDYNLSLFISQHLYTLTERIMILVRSLQRSEGDVSDPIKYIYSTSRSSHIRLSVCPSVSTKTSQISNRW